MMSVEQSVECLAGETEILEKTCPSAALFTTNTTWLDKGPNPGRLGGKPTNKFLNYCTAQDFSAFLKDNWHLKFFNTETCTVLNYGISVLDTGPPLWSSGQSSWLQIKRSEFDSQLHQIRHADHVAPSIRKGWH
jgi:hypothetical protein